MFLRYFLTFKSRKFSHTKNKWQKKPNRILLRFFSCVISSSRRVCNIRAWCGHVENPSSQFLPYEAFRDSSEPGRICFWPRKWFASGKFNSNLLRTDFKISATFGVGNFWLHNVRKCLLNDLFWLLIVEISTFSLADFFSHPENLSYFFVET